MKKMLSSLVAMLLSVSLLTACGAAGSNAPGGGEADSVKVGVLAPLTGANAEFGKGFEVAMTMAMEEVNAAGGINGKTLELVFQDSKGDAKESSDLCRQYVDNEDIVAVLGDFTSTACMADAPIVKEAEMAILSPTASNPAFTEMNDCTFGIIGKQDADSRYYAHYVLQEYAGVDNVGIIYIESDWDNAAMSNFVDEAGKIGLNIVEMASFVQDEKDFSSIITKMKAANPDHIAIMDQGATSQIINQIRTSGWDVSLSTNGPGTSQQLIDLCGENCEGLLLTTPFFFDPENEKEMAWRDEFTERAGFAPTVHSVNAYDCALLISEAIRQCGDDITRENVRDKLAAIDFSGGLTGQIKFDETGSLDRRYIICEIVDGEYVKRAGFDYPEQVAAGK
ncbi:ABC transporter substrate-binding protein [Ruthenibacterium lactatiformans]|uniref:ABC transporter substrate-binding protein n=1 Tax=Ruthenibacterium lactatiformans TaxID=1550024 RepID=UPI00196805E0|nr:ABC transporter substrate-binding protein [Ruthenibacterium lactatiformans]MBN3017133.1 ABC transporter substrate-binding protein [Ruthenibacterium lactatiformans]